MLSVVSDSKLISSGVELLYNDDFFKNDDWYKRTHTSMELTDDRQLRVLVFESDGGVYRSLALDAGEVVFQLKVNRDPAYTNPAPIYFQITDAASNVLYSEAIPPSGLVNLTYTVPANGTYFVRVVASATEESHLVYYLDDFYVYHITSMPNEFASLYLPDVLTYNDYDPFGMLIPRRHVNTDEYRFGFNGKEMDDEVMGEGNFQDYGMRIYNPRIGRFQSVDPLTHEYSSLTPYQFASNSPIAGIDRDGEEFQPSEATTVSQKIREYERDLYKKDAKHAEEIIRQHNIDAFLFVGGALSAGSSILATAFMDGTFTYGGYKAIKGTLNNKPKEILAGTKIMGSILVAEFGGTIIGNAISKAIPLARVASEISTMKPSYTMSPEEFFVSGSIQKAIGKVKGVYKFTMEDGTSIYIGKAGGVDGLAQRVKTSYNEVVNGTKTKLPKAGPNAVLKQVDFYELDPFKFKSVDAMERQLIEESGGIKNLINKRNAKKE